MAIRATASTSRAVLQHATARSHAGLATVTRRTISATALRRSGPGSGPGSGDDGDDPGFVRPGPPPLPPSEQREFERLVREKANTPQFKPVSLSDDKHPQYRAKPVPEFEGDTNPKTGEVGGPKNDPLRWEREWTFGGRSTDF